MGDCASCGEPIRDVAVICHREASRLATRLVEAADLWPHVAETVWRQDRLSAPGPRPRGLAPPEPIRPDGGDDQALGWPLGLPVNLRAGDSRDWVQLAVGTWARVVAGETGADLPTTVPATMRWLAGRTGWMRYQTWAGEALDELQDACAEVARTVDRRPLRARFAVGPCPEACAGTVWARVPESERHPATLACDGCATVWDSTRWAGVGRRILRMREAA